MVLKSLMVINMLGWLTGIVPLTSPCGEVKYKGWRSALSLYSLIVHVGNTLFWLDLYIAVGALDLTQLDLGGLFQKSINIITFLVYTYSKCFLRWKGKELVRLMQNLDLYQLREHNKLLKMPMIWGVILGITLVLHASVASLMPTNLESIPLYRNNSIVYGHFPKPARVLVTAIFGSIPEWSSTIIPMSYAVILIHHLITLLEAQCYRIQLYHSTIFQVQNCLVGSRQRVDVIEAFSNKKDTHIIKYTEFDKLKSFFESYDAIFGPILASLFLLGTATIVNTITYIVADELTLTGTLYHVSNLFLNLTVFGLTEFGHWIHLKIRNMKEGLRRYIREVNRDGGGLSRKANNGIIDMGQSVLEWKWRLTAAGFFVIDRSLVPGILSTSLAMTVILFQLQAAEKLQVASLQLQQNASN